MQNQPSQKVMTTAITTAFTDNVRLADNLSRNPLLNQGVDINLYDEFLNSFSKLFLLPPQLDNLCKFDILVVGAGAAGILRGLFGLPSTLKAGFNLQKDDTPHFLPVDWAQVELLSAPEDSPLMLHIEDHNASRSGFVRDREAVTFLAKLNLSASSHW